MSHPEYTQTVGYQPSYLGSGSETSYNALAKTLSKWSGVVQKEREITAKEEGFAAGKVAGNKKNDVLLPDGGSIREDSFIAGANAAHLAAVKVDINQNLSRIKSEANGSPELYESKVAGYKKGLLEGTTADVSPLAAQEIDYESTKIYSSLVSKKMEQARKNQAAQVELGLEVIQTEGLNAANESDEKGLLKSLSEYSTLLQQAEDSNLIPAGSRVKRLGEYTKTLRAGVYIGEFGRALDSGKAVPYIIDFDKSKNKEFTPKEREEIVATMIGKMNQTQSLAKKEITLDNDARKVRYAETATEATILALEGNLDPGYLVDKLKSDSINPTLARTLEKTAKAKGVKIDDAAQVLEYALDLLDYSEQDIAIDNTLTRETRLKLIKDRRSLVEDKGNWRNSQSGREAVRRIKAEFGMVNGLIAQLNPEVAKKAGRVLTSLFETIEALPLEQRISEAVKIADVLIEEIKKEDIEIKIKDKEKILLNLPYPTIELLDAAGLGKFEDGVNRSKLLRIMGDIERLKSER